MVDMIAEAEKAGEALRPKPPRRYRDFRAAMMARISDA